MCVGGGGLTSIWWGALHSVPMYLLFGAVYWSLGRQGYIGVSNVAFVTQLREYMSGRVRFFCRLNYPILINLQSFAMHNENSFASMAGLNIWTALGFSLSNAFHRDIWSVWHEQIIAYSITHLFPICDNIPASIQFDVESRYVFRQNSNITGIKCLNWNDSR